MNDSERLVYSTDSGRICPDCELPVKKCECSTAATAILGDGRVRVQRESKGRKGKTVSVVSGVPLPQAELKELARELKALCGCGGTNKGGVIEIQGDHVQLLVKELRRRGYDAKAAGG